jgi:Fanconi anemia group I protein
MSRRFINMVGGEVVLSTFSLALLFSLARIPFIEDDVFRLLKASITGCFTDKSKHDASPWIASLPLSTDHAIDTILHSTVQASATGWDHITQSLVKFGFVLLDASGALRGCTGSQAYAANVGVKVLLKLFELHDMVRCEILEQCFTRIITHSGNVDRVVRVLRNLVTDQPRLMLDFMRQIKDLIDYVSFLRPEVASQLMNAVQPLLQLRPDLRDYVIIVLRKAVFNKEPTSRLIAVSGFVELVVGSCIQEASSTELLENAIATTFGLFRRCLTQQCCVREKVYSSLATICRTSSLAQQAVAEMLQRQFDMYYEPADSSADDIPPLKLDRCVRTTSQAVLEEPLSALIDCIHRCIHLASADRDTFAQLARDIDDAIERLALCSPDDFAVSETCSGMVSTDEHKNAMKAVLLCEVCEAAIEFSVLKGDQEQASRKINTIVLPLFNGMHAKCAAVSASFKKASKAQLSKSQRQPGSAELVKLPPPRSYLSLVCLTRILKSLCNQQDGSRRNVIPFRSFVYQRCSELLSRSASCSFAESLELAAVLIDALQKHRDQSLSESEPTPSKSASHTSKQRGRPPTVLALQCFSLLVDRVKAVCAGEGASCDNHVAQVLRASAAVLTPDQPVESVSDCFHTFERLVDSLLSEGSVKEGEILLQVMCSTASIIEPTEISRHTRWLDTLVEKQRRPSAGVGKAFVRLTLQFSGGSKLVDTLDTLAKDLNLALGSSHDATTFERAAVFGKMISVDTADAIAPVILGSVDFVLQEVTWAIGKLKCSVAGEARVGLENSVYKRMTDLVGILQTLTTSSGGKWSTSESVRSVCSIN